jgi:hypothetical protein
MSHIQGVRNTRVGEKQAFMALGVLGIQDQTKGKSPFHNVYAAMHNFDPN